MKSQPEQPYDFIGLVLEQDKGNGTVKVQQRNYFKAGEVVECLTPAGDVFPVTIGHLTNKDGEEAAAAPSSAGRADDGDRAGSAAVYHSPEARPWITESI